MAPSGAPEGANRICLVCGRPYHACKRCDELKARGLLSWRMNCDTPACYQVFVVLYDYSHSRISKIEARALLDRLLSEAMKPYEPGAKTLIEEIYRDSD